MGNTEVEVKLRLASAIAGHELLCRAGFTLLHGRVFEANVLYDTPSGRFRGAGQLLRLRQAGRLTLLTYKGPGMSARHKVREELEVGLSEAAAFEQILLRLGLEPSFRYEKYRTEYQAPRGRGLATVDETPIGDFMELEGPPDWIDSTARHLGFEESDYITASYAQLYFDHLGGEAALPAAMVFGRQPAGS